MRVIISFLKFVKHINQTTLKFVSPSYRFSKPVLTTLIGCPIIVYAAHNVFKLRSVQAADVGAKVKLTATERRFIEFASSVYNGQLYMTPADFLDCVTQADPRARNKRRLLTEKDVKFMKEETPTLNKGSARMFRDLKHVGIISYVEYLFLLSVLTKPPTTFRVAFNMFDRDGNEKVDKNEFLLIEKIFSQTWKNKRGINSATFEGQYVDDEQGLQRKHRVDTTLVTHFFGSEGKFAIDFESFSEFMKHLQTEILEMEFSEFSKGTPTISEIEFVKILLRYSYLDIDEYDAYLDLLQERMPDMKGITFKEFKDFSESLNYLDDIHYALHLFLFTIGDLPKNEFHRCIKVCTNVDLSMRVVDVIYALFRTDEGILNIEEFCAIMKDRVRRNFMTYTRRGGWKGFKACVKSEINIRL